MQQKLSLYELVVLFETRYSKELKWSCFSIFLTFWFLYGGSLFNLDSRLEMITEYSQDLYKDMSIPNFMKQASVALF